MNLKIRLATLEDLDHLEAIVNDAIASMNEQGLPQWQNGYGPNRDRLTEDITSNQLYVGTLENRIVGMAVLVFGTDPAYTRVNGQFHPYSHLAYLSIHRFAIDRTLHQKGLGTAWLRTVCQFATTQGYNDLRIDTHPLNIGMQKVILANDFSYCGTIEFPIPNGERFVYQYLMETPEKTCH